MRFLLDTNVVSELAKAEPDKRVAEWFEKVEASDAFISVITLGELRKGVDRLPESKRRQQLAQWLEQDLVEQFEGRVLPVDEKTADVWGSLAAKARRPMPALDGLIAATAMQHKLKLVTRNTGDFDYPGLSVIDPWKK